MGSLIQLSKQVLVVFVLCSGRTDCTSTAEAGNLGTDVRHSGEMTQSYFFYQQSEYPRDCHEALRGCTSLNSSGVYVIKPDGFPEPFDVYCDHVGLSGWTVIQRRVDGSVNFNRLWEDYRNGFGFISSNYWLGNEKLSYITNQAAYELRIDIELSNGTSLYITYSGFRISDEWDSYRILQIGDFSSGGGGSITFCSRNMIYGNCTCQGTCEEPSGSAGCHTECELGTEGCFCPVGLLMNGNECVPPSDCTCFWSGVNVVVPNGQSYVNDDCTERRNCTNNQLVSDDGYGCGTNAACTIRDGTRQCYCNEGYGGNGQTCVYYKDCFDVYNDGHTQDGVYSVLPTNWTGPPFNVSCVMSNGGTGGWTAFQKRQDNTVSFYRDWANYKNGFGNIDTNYWLGNDKLFYLTAQGGCRLRIDMSDFEGESRYAVYDDFRIGDESELYKLYIGEYSGNAGDSLSNHNNMYFSTKDRDNDAYSSNCATSFKGAWWYYNCHHSNLNGLYLGGSHSSYADGMEWYHWHGHYYSLKTTEMKVRCQS